MATTVELSSNGLAEFDFDSRVRYPYNSRASWPMPLDQTTSRATSQRMTNVKRSTSPLEGPSQGYEQTSLPHSQNLMPEWSISQAPVAQFGYHPLDTTFPQQYDGYTVPYQTSPTEFMPTPSQIDISMQMDNSYLSMTHPLDSLPFDWQEFPRDIQNDLPGFPTNHGMPDLSMQQQNLSESSPTDTYEVRSHTSSSSDNGWNQIDYPQRSLDSSMQEPIGAIFNPGLTLHNRSFSESSYSDIEPSRGSWGSSYVNINPISSPETDSIGDMDFHHIHTDTYEHVHDVDDEREPSNSPPTVTSALVQPINIKKPASHQRSPVSTGRNSPPGRRQSRKQSNPKPAKQMARRPSQAPKVETEKKVGRRKGPLKPDQRKQACEIRKLGACLRCRFLKKTVSAYNQRNRPQLMLVLLV